MLRVAIALALTGGLWQGACQSAPDPDAFAAFLVEVAGLKNSAEPVLVNGRPSELRRPSVREAIGLTEEESKVLAAVASDCAARIRALDAAAGNSVFDARLRMIESEADSQALQKVRDLRRNLNNERARIVSAHIERLRTAFGDSRFEVLNAFVRSRQGAPSFFPLGK
jgi:hypothetical protein